MTTQEPACNGRCQWRNQGALNDGEWPDYPNHDCPLHGHPKHGDQQAAKPGERCEECLSEFLVLGRIIHLPGCSQRGENRLTLHPAPPEQESGQGWWNQYAHGGFDGKPWHFHERHVHENGDQWHEHPVPPPAPAEGLRHGFVGRELSRSEYYEWQREKAALQQQLNAALEASSIAETARLNAEQRLQEAERAHHILAGGIADERAKVRAAESRAAQYEEKAKLADEARHLLETLAIRVGKLPFAGPTHPDSTWEVAEAYFRTSRPGGFRDEGSWIERYDALQRPEGEAKG